MRPIPPAVLTLCCLLAGCAVPAADLAPAAAPRAEPARLLDAERVEVGVPVPILLVGFEPGTAAALAKRLTPERVAATWSPIPRPVPPDPHELRRVAVPVPLVAEARYEVREAPAGLVDAFRARAAADWGVPGEPGILDAVAADAWLAEALRDAGLLPDACCPGLVLLHMGTVGEHGWRASFENGYIQPIRYFGERATYGVLDVSARPDPNGHPMIVSPARPYAQPIPAGGAATVDALEAAARDAVRYRLLHTPIYPMATAPCHAVTLLLAIRATALTERLPGSPRAEDVTYVDLLRGHFENLTGGTPVHLDLKVLRLPQDDPALEVLTRGPVVNTVGVWQWVDANWEDYWVAHEGCEPYVSVMVVGDALEPGGTGVGLYAGNWTHRISVSLIGEGSRLFWNRTLPTSDEPEPGGARQVEHRPGWFTYFWAHEAGHTFGMAHTQDYTREDGAGPSQLAFSTGLSAMGYEVQGPTSDFGAVDRATFARHRAGWAVFEARAAGLEATPEFEDALLRLGARDWVGAWRALLPLLHPTPEGSAR